MKVSELAKELKTTNAAVLEQLKALKLKAKDGNQELNGAVLSVLRSALAKRPKAPAQEEPQSPPEKVVAEKEKKVSTKKKTSIKAVSKKSEESAASKKKEVAAATVIKDKTKATTKEVDRDVKAKPRISPQPFVALKPFAKRKRKTLGRGGRDESTSETPGVLRKDSEDFPRPIGDSASLQSNAGVPTIASEQLQEIEINVPISVGDFAVKVKQKPNVVLKKLLLMGFFANINQNLDQDVVQRLAQDFGFSLAKVRTQEEQIVEEHKFEGEQEELLETRAPVITFMGHVDHGKTSLLDQFRKSRLVDDEHGGITQHIGAYSINLPKGRITFLDTPGHEAFTAMRARGAYITDLVVLVIAADEGIMPQTEEAINHARAAQVPIVVALNKIDRPGADIDRVKKQLSDHDLSPEDWGGKTICVGVSAKTGEGLDRLLEMILLESELLELRANSQKKASGIVVEAHLSQGRGPVASLIVQSGTLRPNDFVVVGPYYGKAKAMFDDLERPISEAGPSTPVEILGLPGVPEAGEMFYVVKDEKQAKEITGKRQEKLKDQKMGAYKKMITLEDIYTRIQEGKLKELSIIIKADVQGSLEALKDSLEKIPSDEVKLKLIHGGIGDVNASDVILANASSAIIIAFHVDVDHRAVQEMEKQPVDVRQYRIIYDAVNDVRKAMEGLLDPTKKRKFLAKVEVRQVFKLSKSGIVAGCFVTKGKITRKARIDVKRNGEVVFNGTISSVKRFKDDVKEVLEGFECGITIDKFNAFEPGDILEAYEEETIARTLQAVKSEK